jgi:predicted HTH domain antitoxin
MNTETELQKKSVDSMPDSFDYGIKLTGFELDYHLRLMAALKMFELGKISSGRAAQLAGMSRVDFLDTCGRYRISPFNYSDSDAEQEIAKELSTISTLSGR